MPISYREQKEKRTQRRRSHAERRKLFRRDSERESKRIQESMRQYLNDCGLTSTQIADFSGFDPSTVNRFRKGYLKTARLNTAIALLRVAGYDIEIVKKDEREDPFRKYRRVSLPPLDENR